MADVLCVCTGDCAGDAGFVRGMGEGACLALHRVRCCEAYLAEDARRVVCRFRAPDAQSVRLALRSAEGAVWPALVIGGDGAAANLVLEREFPMPPHGDAARTLALARAECAEACGVEPLHLMVSLDLRHLLCLCRVPEATAARLAGIERLEGRWRCWRCRHVAAPSAATCSDGTSRPPRTAPR